jgi:chaperonin GroEL
LVIIADDMDWEALTTIILNKLKWILNILAIKAPWFGDRKKEMIQDIAVLTWARVITSELGMKLENATLDDLWHANNVIASKDKTIIVGWEWDTKEIQERVIMIKQQIEISTSDYDKEKMMERLAKLSGWVAVIKVGAASEVEMKEKKLRIEDALNATRAAVEEWVVAGGWVALLKASQILEGLDLWNEDQNIWVSIVRQALSYPIRQIVENAWKEWSVIINKIVEEKSINYGYNAANDTFVDMVAFWIIDPKKVERVALEEAISLAWMFLTTEAAVTEIPKKDDGCNWSCSSGWAMWGMWMPWMGMY